MIYIVSGMARTGTSMMMHALIKGGIPAVYEVGKDARLKIRTTEDYDPNPDGLFEITHEHLLERFPDAFEDELVKIHDWQWDEIGEKLSDTGLMIVYMVRNKQDVIDSLCKFCGSREPTSDMIERANMQVEVAQAVSCRQDAKEVVMVKYQDVLADPLPVFEFIKGKGFPIKPEKAARVIRPEYCHFGGEAVTA